MIWSQMLVSSQTDRGSFRGADSEQPAGGATAQRGAAESGREKY